MRWVYFQGIPASILSGFVWRAGYTNFILHFPGKMTLKKAFKAGAAGLIQQAHICL